MACREKEWQCPFSVSVSYSAFQKASKSWNVLFFVETSSKPVQDEDKQQQQQQTDQDKPDGRKWLVYGFRLK